MELFTSNIKKILILFQKKAFLIFPEMEPWTFRPRPQNFLLKNFLIFFPKKSYSEKKFHIFSKKPLIFKKRKPPKNLHISGNETFLYFGKSIFRTLA